MLEEVKLIKHCPYCKVMNNILELKKDCGDGDFLFIIICQVCGYNVFSNTRDKARQLWKDNYSKRVKERYMLSPQTRKKIQQMFGDKTEGSESK